uniref:Scr1 family TA system antitoxin-like transcriptional regulator n=1 Tax=Streptomyces hawaiiensis TaxID=67305 RepID=UPI0031DCF979
MRAGPSRIERREILHRKVPPTTSFVVWEAALRDRLGGREVYVEQLRHLREYADLPGLTLQVLPLPPHLTSPSPRPPGPRS